MSDETKVRIPLQDLCRIAKTVAGMMHDLDNGKWKYLDIDISNIHVITERWAVDETMLGGGCHPDHRCRQCRSFPVLLETRTGWSRQTHTDAVPSEPDDQQDPEPAEVSSPTIPAEDKESDRQKWLTSITSSLNSYSSFTNTHPNIQSVAPPVGIPMKMHSTIGWVKPNLALLAHFNVGAYTSA